jgi:hypothetical protein
MINNGIPTLIIGLGGIGGQIAGSINQSLSEQDKKTVSVIAIDTHVSDIYELSHKFDMTCIHLGDDIARGEDIERILEGKKWYPKSDFTEHILCICGRNGTGMIRANARLAFVNAEKQKRLGIIEKEIARIRNASHELGNSNQIKVCIVGTITGGTGSGLAVCLPFYIRHLLKKIEGIKKCELKGYFIGADPIHDLMPSSECRVHVRANAYACLK